MTVRRTLITATAVMLTAAPFTPVQGQSGNFASAATWLGGDVFVGQPANFYGPGAVYSYRSDGNGSWFETNRLFAPDSALGDGFGRSLSASDQHLLVGAPNHADGGAAYVFERQADGDGGWSAGSLLLAPGAQAGAAFGAAVALEHGHGFVGAPGAEESGVVYQVRVVGGELTVTATLRPTDLPASRFGATLSLDEDLLLVGAPDARSGDGVAVLFRRNAGGAWIEDGVLSAEGAPGHDDGRFGTSVHVSGGRAFVGVPRGAEGAGAILVFEAGDEGWHLVSELGPVGAVRGSGLGVSLETVGGELWAGAPNGGGGDGVVYRFGLEDGERWSPLGSLSPDSANTGAWPFGFGSSIAAMDDVVVVGMPRRDFGEGRAAVFSRSAEGQWDETATVFGEIATAVSAIEAGADCEDGAVGLFECNNMEVISFTPVSALGGARGVWVNDVWGWSDPVTGRDYALVSRRDGAAFVDLTDPAAPRLVGSLPRTGGTRPTVWRDIKVVRDHAYIVSDGAGPHGMQVFDLSRLREVGDAPVIFTEDAHYNEIHSAHNVVADTASGFLYIVGSNGGGQTCGGGLHMVDVREPKAPVFAGCYNDPTGRDARGYTHDAQCVVYRGPDSRYTGRQICVGANEVEINIADVTDKDRPVPIGRSGYPNSAYAHQGWLDESHRYFYMGDEGDEVAGLVQGTRTLVWDIGELDDPILIREYIGPVEATDHNLFIRGDRAYMSNYGSGLRVLDISDPENPHEVAFFDSAPVGNNEAGMSATASGAWSNYPFFESGLVVFTSVREGLFVVRVKPRPLIP